MAVATSHITKNLIEYTTDNSSRPEWAVMPICYDGISP